jgi:hypothetical protein
MLLGRVKQQNCFAFVSSAPRLSEIGTHNFSVDCIGIHKSNYHTITAPERGIALNMIKIVYI